jgi:hypothetical protein
MRVVNERARALWARTTLHVWPEPYRLVSLPPTALGAAAALVSQASDGFSCLVRERDEVSLTLAAAAWAESPLRARARGDEGPFRVITLDLALDLDVTGYSAPAAEALAAARVPIVPQCAFLKDHVLVPEGDLPAAIVALEGLVARAREGA